MAVTEEDILRDEQERSNLLKAIASVETEIAVSTPGTRRVLENTVDNAKKRIVVLDKKIEEAKVERAAEQQAQTAAAIMAAKETKLNAKEQETYRSFLEESYFTKRDFGKLDEFYKHSYDRLSNEGKDQMSKRFWEGVKHGEYQFKDAPAIMQRKEAERARNRLGLDALDAKQLGEMPGDEQRAFADAYNSEDHAKAKELLVRNAVSRKHPDLDIATQKQSSAADKSSAALSDIDLSTVDLKNVQLAQTIPITSASLPDASGTRVNAR